jgi:probable rRNA maturation factor
LDCPDGELSILIVDDNEIARLNKKYLQREGPTNVIAFPMRDENFPGAGNDMLGDVVISVETAEREGNKSGVGIRKRFAELLVHGILHLFGYDHENNVKEARRMNRKSRELLKKVNSEKAIGR